MGIAEGMKDIVQDIVSSRDARVAEVKGLKKEANEMLGSFKASHKKMGAQLRRELADDKAKMEAEVKAMRSGFQSSRKEMSQALRKGLAEDSRGVKGEVAKMRQQVKASHKEMSTELKKELIQGVAVRKPEVAGMLGDFQKSRKLASAQLRRELADYDRGIKSEVAGMRRETKADLREARTAWQELTRGVKKAAVAEEIPDLEAKMLASIREHPQGITLTEVAESLGIAPIVLGRAAKRLVDGGNVRKEDKLYFLAGTERG